MTLQASPPAVGGSLLAAELLRELAGFGTVREYGGTVIVHVPHARLPEAVRLALRCPGARFADLFGTDGPPLVLRTVLALDRDARYLVLQTPVESDTMPWLSDVVPAAFVEECELFEQFGLQPPEGHMLNRLMVAPVSAPHHPRLDAHEHPARDTHLPFIVEGQAFEFPVGPVRATAVESLYYGLVTSGEEVVDVYLHTWHKYRGIERRLRGQTPQQALFLVERGEGLSAASAAAAFAAAVESALGLDVPQEVRHARAVYIELERLYNHAQCAAALAQSTGLRIGQSQAELATELLLRLDAAVGGHRYLFGAVDVARSPRPPDISALRDLLPAAYAELCRVMDGLLSTNAFLDRVEATGIITPEQSAELGLVGPIARACGAPIDSRADHSASGLPLDLRPAVRDGGDCLARLLVRRAEVDQSKRLLDQLVDAPPLADCEPGPRRGWGLGVAESPRGEILAWVELDDNGRIARARIRTASARNWRAFDDAVRSQNVFTDVPIIEASFWLTVAGRVL